MTDKKIFQSYIFHKFFCFLTNIHAQTIQQFLLTLNTLRNPNISVGNEYVIYNINIQGFIYKQ